MSWIAFLSGVLGGGALVALALLAWLAWYFR